MDQLCDGMEVGIHGMHLLQQHQLWEDYWYFILIYMWNVFSEDNWMSIFQAMWCEWTRGVQFTFNFYHHRATLVIGNTGWSGHFLRGNKELTQVDPLYIISYDIGILPLIRYLCKAHTAVMQHWCADDAGLGRKFPQIKANLEDLMIHGPACGYFPETNKIILFIYKFNVL